MSRVTWPVNRKAVKSFSHSQRKQTCLANNHLSPTLRGYWLQTDLALWTDPTLRALAVFVFSSVSVTGRRNYLVLQDYGAASVDFAKIKIILLKNDIQVSVEPAFKSMASMKSIER